MYCPATLLNLPGQNSLLCFTAVVSGSVFQCGENKENCAICVCGGGGGVSGESKLKKKKL
jgi:hypothetical protein